VTPELGQALTGVVALITADRRAGEFATALTRRGATVRHAPALSIVPHVDDAELLARTRELIDAPPEVVVVTTGIGFRGWIEAADAAGLAGELHDAFAGARIIARGPKARGAVLAADLSTDWVAESETSAEVLEYLLTEDLVGTRIAVQHHGAGADGLDEELAAAGADVVSLVVYRWGPPTDPAAVRRSTLDAAAGEIDLVAFTSAPGAHAWLAAARGAGALDAIRVRCAAGTLLAAAVGPVTARPLQNAGIEPLVPDRGRLGALVRAIVRHHEDLHTDSVLTPVGALRVQRTAALLDGHVLPLRPSGLEVLRLLAERPGEVVTRDQVLAVLPGCSSDPHAAEVAVARVREVVGRDLIATVVKRGYRLAVAPAGRSAS
jgi:uroporphyrinogen-III synthase